MLIMLKSWLKVTLTGSLFFVGTNIVLTFVSQEGPRRDTRAVACNYGRLTERDDKKKYHPAFFFRYGRKETRTLRFIAPHIFKKKH